MTDCFMYQAALICTDCARAVMAANGLTAQQCEQSEDSDTIPRGPYADGGGEADSPEHCDHCQAFLANALTPDGCDYVISAVADHAKTGRGSARVLAQWRERYSYLFDD